MPGVITAVYLVSDNDSLNDENTSTQDEIDLEFRGNEPTKVVTNVYLGGEEALEVVDVGTNTSAAVHSYTVHWNDKLVFFYIDGKQVRVKGIERPLRPLRIVISVWTTQGGWPGLLEWGGDTDWSVRGNKPCTAEFDLVALPAPIVNSNSTVSRR